MELKILFFGDIDGKIGRQAIKKIVPQLKKELKPDLIIANVENIAHGVGVTKKTLNEIESAGVDVFTSGNHVWKKEEAKEILQEKESKLLRPENYLEDLPGKGYKIIKAGKHKVLVINLLGQVFMHQEFASPFETLDNILYQHKNKKLDAIIVDFHCEATSEKNALGWYADGQVSAVLGTHTHVPTADAKILTKGTAYITDVGMVGAKNSIIGEDTEIILHSFLTGEPFNHEIPEKGVVQVNSVLLTIDPKTRLAKDIKRVDKEVEIC